MELFDFMMTRRSIRKYTGERVPEEKLERILQAGLAAFSGRNLDPWELIVVRDKGVLEKLAASKKAGSAMLKGADCAIVVLGEKEKSDTWVEDCSIVMTYMHLMAAELGVGSCWIQIRMRQAKGNVDSEAYVKELLEIPEHYGVEAILSLGMPAEERAPKQDDELSWDKVHRERI